MYARCFSCSFGTKISSITPFTQSPQYTFSDINIASSIGIAMNFIGSLNVLFVTLILYWGKLSERYGGDRNP